jgi:hypothetical protein
MLCSPITNTFKPQFVFERVERIVYQHDVASTVHDSCDSLYVRSAERPSSAAADVTTANHSTTSFTAVSCSDWFGLKPLRVLYVLLTDCQDAQTTI